MSTAFLPAVFGALIVIGLIGMVYALIPAPPEPGARTRRLRKSRELLELSLDAAGVSAPDGFAYQGHSIRSMGAAPWASIRKVTSASSQRRMSPITASRTSSL